MPQDKQILIFSHLPKCGGSTIGHAFASAQGKDEFLPLHYSRIGDLRRRDEIFFTRKDVDCYLEKMSVDSKNRIQFISGHLAYPGIHRFFEQKPQYIVFFRHPLKRTLSHYRFLYQRAESGGFLTASQKAGLFNNSGTIRSFCDWLESNPRFHNYMVSFFKGVPEVEDIKPDQNDLERTKEILSGAFIGLTETLDDDLFYLSCKWPVGKIERKNVTRHLRAEASLSSRDEVFLKQFLELDYQLYNWAVERHRFFITQKWDYYPSVLMQKAKSFLNRSIKLP